MERESADTPYALDPAEVARVEEAVIEGRLDEGAAWFEGVCDDLKRLGIEGMPPVVEQTVDDIGQLAGAVYLAREGTEQELRDYLADCVRALDDAPEDERPVLRARNEKTVAVLKERGLAPPGDLLARPARAEGGAGARPAALNRLFSRQPDKPLLHGPLRVAPAHGRGRARVVTVCTVIFVGICLIFVAVGCTGLPRTAGYFAALVPAAAMLALVIRMRPALTGWLAIHDGRIEWRAGQEIKRIRYERVDHVLLWYSASDRGYSSYYAVTFFNNKDHALGTCRLQLTQQAWAGFLDASGLPWAKKRTSIWGPRVPR